MARVCLRCDLQRKQIVRMSPAHLIDVFLGSVRAVMDEDVRVLRKIENPLVRIPGSCRILVLHDLFKVRHVGRDFFIERLVVADVDERLPFVFQTIADGEAWMIDVDCTARVPRKS